VEATAVLGANPPLASVTALAEVANLVDAIDEAADLNLLRISDETGISRVRFSHPLVQPAVYQLLGPARRTRLHAGAAAIVEDEATVLRHRAMASIQPNAGLANELETYARHESTVGAWVHAAWALAEGSRLSPGRRQRQLRLLRAVAAMISAGDLIQAEAFAREAAAFAPGPLRDSTVGYLAMLHGRASEAEQLLHAAWEQADPMGQPEIAAVVAQRLALHEVGRLRGREVVEWARRAVELSSAGDPIRVEAEALLGIGLGWLGRVPEGLANCESVLARLGGGHDGPPTAQVRVADGWLRLVADDVEGAQAELAQTAPAILRSGSTGNAMWAYVWLARTRFVAGAWDAAAADAERAVSLLEQSGLEWLGPLVRLTATLVPAARGEWAAAEEHAREATSQLGGYELMVLAAALARAHVASARDDHEAVLRALEPVVGMRVREGVDEPGYWLWQDLYADALVSSGRLAEAEAFLRTHEELATSRGRGSALGGLARARGRLEAAQGHLPEAEAAFRRGLLQLQSLPMPFQRALLELAFGKVLRRVGQRRAAADRLRAARERLVALRARPYLARCDQELAACGLAPGKRRASGPIRLTAQELAVARLVAVGMSNREVAAELFISIKTVQYHVTHIYAKLGVRSRAELAAQFRENELMNDASGPVEGPIQ
jgi:DNA-binding CsgD family transcriptional regulator